MFALDRESGVPLPSQIAAHIRALIAQGTMRAGDAVPSSRQLAGNLQVSRGTVVAAYDQLVAEGYLVTRPGGATRVHPAAVDTRARAVHEDASSGSRAAEPGKRFGGPREDSAYQPAHPRPVYNGRPLIDLRPGFSRE